MKPIGSLSLSKSLLLGYEPRVVFLLGPLGIVVVEYVIVRGLERLGVRDDRGCEEVNVGVEIQ